MDSHWLILPGNAGILAVLGCPRANAARSCRGTPGPPWMLTGRPGGNHPPALRSSVSPGCSGSGLMRTRQRWPRGHGPEPARRAWPSFPHSRSSSGRCRGPVGMRLPGQFTLVCSSASSSLLLSRAFPSLPIPWVAAGRALPTHRPPAASSSCGPPLPFPRERCLPTARGGHIPRGKRRCHRST